MASQKPSPGCCGVRLFHLGPKAPACRLVRPSPGDQLRAPLPVPGAHFNLGSGSQRTIGLKSTVEKVFGSMCRP
eukprot:7152411-Alexandrium_andersonii.AAC.1